MQRPLPGSVLDGQRPGGSGRTGVALLWLPWGSVASSVDGRFQKMSFEATCSCKALWLRDTASLKTKHLSLTSYREPGFPLVSSCLVFSRLCQVASPQGRYQGLLWGKGLPAWDRQRSVSPWDRRRGHCVRSESVPVIPEDTA